MNQLLGGSIGLSPLYQDQTSDLHVSTGRGLPSGFLLTSAIPGIDHHLSGPNTFTSRNTKYRPDLNVAFTMRILLGPLAIVLDSSIRVSRRVVSFSHPAERGADAPQYLLMSNIMLALGMVRYSSPRTLIRTLRPFDTVTYSQWHQIRLTLSSECFSPFPRGTCELSVSGRYLALEDEHLPRWCWSINQHYSLGNMYQVEWSLRRALHPLWTQMAQQSSRFIGDILPDISRPTTLVGTRFRDERSLVHSLLLKGSQLVSIPPPTDMFKFGGSSCIEAVRDRSPCITTTDQVCRVIRTVDRSH